MKKLFTLLAALALIGNVAVGQVVSHQKISDTQGNFTGILDNDDLFGSISSIGDLNKDGVADLIAGAPRDDDGGSNKGAVWVLFMNTDGTVDHHQKISSTQGGFNGVVDSDDLFAHYTDSAGDVNGDGVVDLAICAENDDDGGSSHGALWILFMDTSGTVIGESKISDTQGNFTATFSADCKFASSCAPIGDLNGDNVPDIAVGMDRDDDGGTDRGAVFILFLNSSGAVDSYQKISDTQGNFTGVLDNLDRFGRDVTTLGDLDGDGITDIAVGANNDDDGGADVGAVWVLFLNSNGTVKSHQKISATQGGFAGALDASDNFCRTEAISDLNGDGITDLLVGAPWDDDGGTNHGAVWILHLDSNGTVKSHQKISDTQGNFTGTLDDDDRFGVSLTAIKDLNNGGVDDIVLGAIWDDDGGTDRGAVWVLFLDSTPIVGINEKEFNNRITIYPNPTEGKFRVESLELGVEKVEVYDVYGRVVLTTKEPQIDMSGFAAGMYYVKVGDAVRKLVME